MHYIKDHTELAVVFHKQVKSTLINVDRQASNGYDYDGHGIDNEHDDDSDDLSHHTLRCETRIEITGVINGHRARF